MTGKIGFVSSQASLVSEAGIGRGMRAADQDVSCILGISITIARSHLWLNSKLVFSTQIYLTRRQNQEGGGVPQVGNCPSYKAF